MYLIDLIPYAINSKSIVNEMLREPWGVELKFSLRNCVMRFNTLNLPTDINQIIVHES